MLFRVSMPWASVLRQIVTPVSAASRALRSERSRRLGLPLISIIVLLAAAANNTMIEINGNPNRRDLSDRNARLAAETGVTICLNTDAHGIDTLNNMRYAVANARRAWLEPKNVANTRTWAQFSK